MVATTAFGVRCPESGGPAGDIKGVEKQKLALDRLTPRRRAFVNYYCGAARFNGTEAARLAGYKVPRQEASRLLSNADVRAVLEERLDEHGLSQQQVAAELAFIAMMNPAGFFSKTKDGRLKLDMVKAMDAGLIANVRKVKLDDGGHVTDVEFYDRHGALRDIGKAHGMFKTVNKQDEGDGVLKIVLVDESQDRQGGGA